MWLVAGLGNPGRKYERTRHNVGFDALDALARERGVKFRKSWRFPAELVETDGADRLLLCKPRTYMNRSGQAIAPILRRKGLALSELIVIVDDTDLECGRLRIRRRGSAGGHNGLKSIIAALGTDEFIRMRIGVGGRPGDRAQIDHVLSGFDPAERRLVDKTIEHIMDAVDCVVDEGVERAMNRFNG